VITAGEGGVVVTDDETSFQRCLMTHDSAMRFWQGDDAIAGFPGENYRLS